MTDSVERLRAIAKEISDEGHAGWPNELNWIADALASERAKQAEPLDPMPPIYPGKRSDYAAPPADDEAIRGRYECLIGLALDWNLSATAAIERWDQIGDRGKLEAAIDAYRATVKR